MAVWLTMNMSYVGVGDSANMSKVAVSVDVHWDYPHFNRDGGALKVTVDGVTDTRTVPFNAGETSSGSQNIYSYYWNISQPNGAAKTVYASATFQATNSTTATPANASLYLSAISAPGGDSGDDDDDDDDDSGGSGDSGGGDSGALLVHPDTNCIYLGTSFNDSEYGNTELGTADLLFGKWHIKFKTPPDLVSSNSVTVRLTNYYVMTSTNTDILLSLFEGSPKDKEAMAQVSALPAGAADTTFDSYDVVIPVTRLKPDTEYVVVMESTSTNLISADAPVGIIIDYTTYGGVHIKIDGVESKHLMYVKNGDTWDLYEPYVKNGESWDKIGG